MEQELRERRILVGAWCFALVFFAVSVWVLVHFRPVTVSFLDIDQGDACLIQAGRGGNVLIDGGDSRSGRTLEGYFQLQNLCSLDAVFISHFHEDHINGIVELLESGFPMKALYISEYSGDSDAERKILSLSEKRKIPVFRLKTGDEITIGKAKYRVLWPGSVWTAKTLNNASMVLRMDYGAASVLFTGDLESAAAKAMTEESGDALKTDILKVPHHGGGSSAQKTLLDTCDADWAIISVGADNQYREPSDAMLALLMDEEMGIWRTDRDGTVVVTLGKEGIRRISDMNRRR